MPSRNWLARPAHFYYTSPISTAYSRFQRARGGEFGKKTEFAAVGSRFPPPKYADYHTNSRPRLAPWYSTELSSSNTGVREPPRNIWLSKFTLFGANATVLMNRTS